MHIHHPDMLWPTPERAPLSSYRRLQPQTLRSSPTSPPSAFRTAPRASGPGPYVSSSGYSNDSKVSFASRAAPPKAHLKRKGSTECADADFNEPGPSSRRPLGRRLAAFASNVSLDRIMSRNSSKSRVAGDSSPSLGSRASSFIKKPRSVPSIRKLGSVIWRGVENAPIKTPRERKPKREAAPMDDDRLAPWVLYPESLYYF